MPAPGWMAHSVEFVQAAALQHRSGRPIGRPVVSMAFSLTKKRNSSYITRGGLPHIGIILLGIADYRDGRKEDRM